MNGDKIMNILDEWGELFDNGHMAMIPMWH